MTTSQLWFDNKEFMKLLTEAAIAKADDLFHLNNNLIRKETPTMAACGGKGKGKGKKMPPKK